jgi:hypothetical protein
MEDIYLTVDTTELDEALCKASMLADIIGSPYVKKLLNMNENELNKLKAKHKRAGKYIAALKKNEESFLYEIERLREKIDKQNRQLGNDYASRVGFPCSCDGGYHGPTE